MSAGDPRAAQVRASNPRASVFVSANAGSGKTSTLVMRVARLLLAGSPPEAILCVTFTKAGAAEMQQRLFKQLGEWAVMRDGDLTEALAAIDEAGRDLSRARVLFARALETPGGLKIQTIHAFCEQLLRRFPLEAGVSPGFTVLEDAAAAEVSAEARADVAALAMARPDSALAEAYAWFSVQLDYRSFNGMFADFDAAREAIATYRRACESMPGGIEADVWRRCGFPAPTTRAKVEQAALRRTPRWRRLAAGLSASFNISDQKLGAAMMALQDADDFARVKALFFTNTGEPRLLRKTMPAELRRDLAEEQAACGASAELIASAAVAEDTVRALTLATAYGAIYEAAKSQRRALDFGDLIGKVLELLTRKADAAWVLYKLDNGIEHVLLDEAQDTAPAQWDILRALTSEFFHGEGAGPKGRTVFAVGDEKQSIFSFQGAAPERLAAETRSFGQMIGDAGGLFEPALLLESWRSSPEILAFVDQVYADGDALAGLRPAGETVTPFDLIHRAIRGPGGCVELWPLEVGHAAEDEADPWAPVDAEPARSGARLLAGRIAGAVAAMVERRDAVADRRDGHARPARYGDVMILVRRRGALFHEIIRALKREGVPVAGADRLKLSEHGVFEDLMALGRLARLAADDLSLAVLLRSPFCDVDEASLFDLAYERPGSLWRALQGRARERAEWGAAARFLTWAMEEAARVPPFDFYCQVLGRLDDQGRSMRQRILTRLGAEGEQALDAFVAQVLVAEGAGVRDLERLLAWMSALDLEIKRDQDEAGGGEVRVMTAHGAKGLESPIVILPDTATRASWQGGRLMAADGAFLWAPRRVEDCPASAGARRNRDKGVEHESARLLYVAMTRARDRLIVCGVAPHPAQAWRLKLSWYDFVQRAFAGLDAKPIALPGGGEGLRFGPDPPTAPAETAPRQAGAVLPAWSAGLAAAEPPSERLASPSRLETDEVGDAPSPLVQVRGLGRYRRGELIHRLLQLLPDAPAAERAQGATRLLAREPGLTDDQRAEMTAAALAVLEDARFAAVFGPGSRAEVPLVGGAAALPAGFTVSGRVDRLVIEADRVLVIDFKTNRPAPARIEDADPAYIRQMAIYLAVLAEVFPTKSIEAALVWTDGPALMPVPRALIDRDLAKLAASLSSRQLTLWPQNLATSDG